MTGALPPVSVSTGAAAVRGEGRAATPVARALPEELPVAVVCNGTTQAVMMATPADIADFALGFLVTEGVVAGPGEVESLEVVAHEQGIEAQVWLAPEAAARLGARRRFMAGPVGCGLCGIDSLEQAVRPLPAVAPGGPMFAASEIAAATEALRGCQPLHDLTRAAHCAGFLRPGAGIVAAREDVGRHNALDKLIGALLAEGIDPASGAFVMTSRLSVELVQKAAMAGCPVLVAVSAPTAHAVRLAEGAGLTLAAFARAGGFDVFTHPSRILAEVSHVA